jgi:hypothetical protein
MEISVKQLFDLFTSHLGHKVTQPKQDKWRSSSEGWDHSALLHMMYWIQREFRGLSHNKSWEVANADQTNLSERLLAEVFEILKEKREAVIDDSEAEEPVA